MGLPKATSSIFKGYISSLYFFMAVDVALLGHSSPRHSIKSGSAESDQFVQFSPQENGPRMRKVRGR